MYSDEEFDKMFSDIRRQKRRDVPITFGTTGYEDYLPDGKLYDSKEQKEYDAKMRNIPVQDYIDLQKDKWKRQSPEMNIDDIWKEDPSYIFGEWSDTYDKQKKKNGPINELSISPISYGKDNGLLTTQEGFRTATYAKYMGIKEIPVIFLRDRYRDSKLNRVIPRNKKYENYEEI